LYGIVLVKASSKKKIMKPIAFLLALLFTLCLFSFKENIPNNFFTIGKNTYSLSFFQLANESYATKSKFEVDLITDNEDLSKAKTFLYFSLTSDNTSNLSKGIYQFSSAALNDRLPFNFNGSVKINNHTVEIIGGTISLENQGAEYDIQFILKLKNGDVAKGIYRGKALDVDRSRAYK
jgi:hypothetical protein